MTLRSVLVYLLIAVGCFVWAFLSTPLGVPPFAAVALGWVLAMVVLILTAGWRYQR